MTGERRDKRKGKYDEQKPTNIEWAMGKHLRPPRAPTATWPACPGPCQHDVLESARELTMRNTLHFARCHKSAP